MRLDVIGVSGTDCTLVAEPGGRGSVASGFAAALTCGGGGAMTRGAAGGGGGAGGGWILRGRRGGKAIRVRRFGSRREAGSGAAALSAE